VLLPRQITVMLAGTRSRFQGHTQAVGMGRRMKESPSSSWWSAARFEVGRIEPLGVHYRARHMPKDQEFVSRKAQVVAVGEQPSLSTAGAAAGSR